MLKKFLQDERGEDFIEYALLAALVSVFLVATLNLLGPAIRDVFNDVIAALNNAT